MNVTPTQTTGGAVAPAAGWSVEHPHPEKFRAFLERAGIHIREGETVRRVGPGCVEITDGAREGMYINTSGNVRHGRAYVIAHRDGRQFHIYGSGTDRLVVRMPEGWPNRPHPRDTSEIKLRQGETIEPVEDRRYAKITSGPREGMYINTGTGPRRGEAFVLTHRHGIECAVYEDSLNLRKGETVKPVPHRRDVEITSGPRSGMFINVSGNSRHGELFVRSIKDGIEYHIYGSGADRLVVAQDRRPDGDDRRPDDDERR
jgi:hypothetical protein